MTTDEQMLQAVGTIRHTTTRHAFAVDEVAETVGGKPVWPDTMRLYIPKRNAYTMIQEMLRQLADDDDVEIVVVGEMVTREDGAQADGAVVE